MIPRARSHRRGTLLLVLALGAVGCREERGPRQAILILLDAARPDRFSCYGYERRTTPEIDRLAASGVVFERCYSQGHNTPMSLPSLFMSRYFTRPLFPASDTVPLVGDPEDLFRAQDEHAISLPRALSDTGFATASISAHVWLRDDSDFAREFDEHHALPGKIGARDVWGLVPAEAVVDFGIEWLDRHAEQDFFLYLHLLDTHFPHDFEFDARGFFGADEYAGDAFLPDGRPRDTSRPLEGEDRRYLDARYDGSLRRTDRELGRLFDHLRAQQRLDDTLVAIVSDHGEHLLHEPHRFSHGEDFTSVLAHVPFILSYPGRIEPGRYEPYCELVDVMPTLLGLLDVELPRGKAMDGDDLSELVDDPDSGKLRVWSWQGVRDEDWVLDLTWDPTGALGERPPDGPLPGARLYNLRADPTETEDVSADFPGVVERYQTLFRERMLAPWLRFSAARTDEQPRGAFAVAASDFRLTPEPLQVPWNATIEELRAAGPGWLRSRSWVHYRLVNLDGNQPIEVRIPMPDGAYRVRLRGRGTAALEVDGLDEDVAVDLGPADLAQSRDAAVAELGVVRVTGETFRARITPDTSESPFLVRSFGFRPRVEGAEPREQEDAAREELLEALGYAE